MVQGNSTCKWCKLGECWTHRPTQGVVKKYISKVRQHHGSCVLHVAPWKVASEPEQYSPKWKKKIGKALVAILRHDGKGEVHATGLMDQAGWVSIGDILQVPSLKRLGCSYEDVMEEAASADVADRSSKQRLEVKLEDGTKFVRACQGHSLPLNFNELLERLTPTSSHWAEDGLHGTFRRNMESILAGGLDIRYSAHGSRAHVHFAVSIDDSRENAGVRGGTDTVVVCDLNGMYDAGMVLYRSRNNVILTPGVEGRVPPEFIKKIYDNHTGKPLYTSA